MTPKKVHCFFEQSGTFKSEFVNLGIPAEDYDIQNVFGETDHVMDLYSEIMKAKNHEPSVFDEIGKDELIFAFFPCIRFEDQILLWFGGKCHSQEKWTDVQKLEYDMKLQQELTDLYIYISSMCIVCLERGIPLIIENPYSKEHYLSQRWCLFPKVIDTDRRERGDKQKKPTQYWFINCEPSNNFIWEAQIVWDESEYTTHRQRKSYNGLSREIMRSMITHEYANRFIREFIL